MVELKIEGMSCDHCVKRVRTTLEKNGAKVEEVTIGAARFEISPDALDAARAAVKKAGYENTVT